MIFWTLVFMLVFFLARRIEIAASEQWRPVAAGWGEVVKDLSFCAAVVCMLVFAWRYLP